MAAEPKSEADLIRALAEDLALEILASYTPDPRILPTPTSRAWARLPSIWPSMSQDQGLCFRS